MKFDILLKRKHTADCKQVRPMRAVLLLCVVLFSRVTFVRAEECFAQAWQGTIGTSEAALEFEESLDGGSLRGKYYYFTDLNDFLLKKDEVHVDQWIEIDLTGKTTGLLSLKCDKGILSGNWRDPNGGKTLPIVASPSPSYSAHRTSAIKTKVVSRGNIRGHRFEIISSPLADQVFGLRLIDSSPVVEEINNALYRDFLSELNFSMDVRNNGIFERGKEHGFEHTFDMKVIAWNQSFLVIQKSYSGYYGGAHIYFDTWVETYSLTSGNQEEIASWFDKAKDITGLLWRRYKKQIGNDEECIDVTQVDDRTSRRWPTNKGFVFMTFAPYAYTGCAIDILVPYREVIPYLTPLGRANVQLFSQRVARRVSGGRHHKNTQTP